MEIVVFVGFPRFSKWHAIGLEELWEWNVAYKVHIRYVGIIRFVLYDLQLLPIKFTRQNLCCISKLVMKHLLKSYRKSDLPSLSNDYRKCMYASSLSEYIGPLGCCLLSLEWLVDFRAYSSMSKNTYLVGCLFIDLTPPYNYIKGYLRP